MVHCFVVNVELNVVDSRCILRRSLITAASGPMKTGSQNSGKDFNSYSLPSIVSTDSVIGYFGDWLACRLTGLQTDGPADLLADWPLADCLACRLTGLQTDWFADWLACSWLACRLTGLQTDCVANWLIVVCLCVWIVLIDWVSDYFLIVSLIC